MKIFISYSFKPENEWVVDYVIPLVRCFGHEPVTGNLLDSGGSIPDEVRKRMQGCRRVLCFVTKAKPRYGPAGEVTAHDPPGWVRDELMMARGAALDAIEFREEGVAYDGAAPFSAYQEFDRSNLPALLVRLAELLKEWPVGPLLLNLAVPDALRDAIGDAAAAGALRAKCRVRDLEDQIVTEQELDVRERNGQLHLPFWVKPDPNLTIEIEVRVGATRLVCNGLSPAIREARMKAIP